MTATEMAYEFKRRCDAFATLSTKSYEDTEISDTLSQAQRNLVINYSNVFEKNEYARKVLSKLVTGPYAKEYVNSSSANEGYPENLDDSSVDTAPFKLKNGNIIFRLPANVLRVVYEDLAITTDDVETSIDVLPITHDEYSRTKRNKYRKSNERKALRLDIQGWDDNELAAFPSDSMCHELDCTLFSTADSVVYKIRYIQLPQNIVYSQVEDDCIDSYLPNFVHDAIVNEAVKLALEISQEPRLESFIKTS